MTFAGVLKTPLPLSSCKWIRAPARNGRPVSMRQPLRLSSEARAQSLISEPDSVTSAVATIGIAHDAAAFCMPGVPRARRNTCHGLLGRIIGHHLPQGALDRIGLSKGERAGDNSRSGVVFTGDGSGARPVPLCLL